MSERVAFYTLGCKVNQYESEAMAGLLASYDYKTVNFDEYADVYIINTCTVTGIADRKCRQVIRRAKANNKNAVVVAMGCYSQVAPEEVAKLADVDIIIGTNERKALPGILEIYRNGNCEKPLIRVGNIKDVREFEELGIETYTEHTRAFLKIQDGCDRYCSYCIIPYARGHVRSRKPEKIISDVKELVDKGYKEFVITGIHLASYGRDLKNTGLIDIINLLCRIDGVKRVRLGSIEPMTINQEFIDFVKGNPKICPHFHISLQSGSDSVLKRMNRRYTSAEYLQRCKMLKESIEGLSLTTDIIVGFPGETSEEFADTVRVAEEIHFSKIHVFKYSPRKGTPAAEMENQVPPEIKEERSRRLIKLSDELGKEFARRMIGSKVMVLLEKQRSAEKDIVYEGHSENYMKVICKVTSQKSRLKQDLSGDIAEVSIYGNGQECLCGTM